MIVIEVVGQLTQHPQDGGMEFPNGLFWAVTEDGDVLELAYDNEATLWIGHHNGKKVSFYSRQDGESGTYAEDELIGWAKSHEEAVLAAELYLEGRI